MELFVLILFGCVPMFLFLYNLIAAIGHNIRQAVRSDEPYQVVAIGNILAASVALSVVLYLFLVC